MSKWKNITDEEFKEAVLSSEFISDILQKLGYGRQSGTMRRLIKERIENLKIDSSHLGFGKGKESRRGGGVRYKLEDILVKDSPYGNITHLKKRLVKENKLSYHCHFCKNKGFHLNKPLVLQLDHINGDNKDHRLENLRFLCPNCHSQTDTFSGKNKTDYCT